MVEVEAADVGEAVLGEDLEPGLGAPDHGRVERAAAEIVDGEAAPHRDGGAEHGGEVGRGTDRLRDQSGRAEPGDAGRLDQQGPAPLTPPRRVGEPHLVGCGAELPAGLGVDQRQHVREQSRHRHRMVTDEHLAVVDATFRVGFEPGRVQPRVALGVPPDQDFAVGVEVQSRGQQGRTVEQQRPHP
ncbi:hypothetical protein OHA72_40505 [Dactylosporangium sp. NBC_01737]|nr:hypothetical protein OHA72_40505 [Dactylosporangium sp. NBC_01737]